MENWIRVFEDQNQIRAEIVRGILEEKGLPAVVLNKKETVYQLHGTYQVLVPQDLAISALQLIQHEIAF